MSRRARIEREKLRHLNEEIEEEENRLKAQRERIYAPIIWKRLTSGIRIQDLKPIHYDQVLHIMEGCYLDEEVLCKNSNMKNDPESIHSLLEMVLFYIKDRTSIVALDETKSDEIAGFFVMKVVRKEDHSNVFGRVFHAAGEAHKKCMNFTNFLNRKFDVFSEFNCDIYLQFMFLCVRPEYRHQGLGFQMCLTGVDIARSLNIAVMMGVYSSWRSQKLGKQLGMKTVHEISYVNWRDRFNEMIFPDPGVGNYTCAVMAGLVPPPPEPEPILEVQKSEEKLTREENRKAKSKKKK